MTMGSIVFVIALFQALATITAQHATSRLVQAGVSVRQPDDGDDDSNRMVIVHEHQHVHEHTHEHEHAHEHEHSHEHTHEHEIDVLMPAPAPAAMAVTFAPAPATVPTTTPDPPTLEPAMARVVVFDEEQLDANIQRMGSSLNTVTSQLNHLRDTLVRWAPSLTTLQAGAATNLGLVEGNRAIFQRLRGTISQAGADLRLNPLLANITTMRATSAAISTQLEGQPPAPPGGAEAAVAAEEGGNITDRIEAFNSTLINEKPAVTAKLEELNSIEHQLTENVTDFTDRAARGATDEILREIPTALMGQVDTAMSGLGH